jgi:RND family efflux transporter MFP subunit
MIGLVALAALGLGGYFGTRVYWPSQPQKEKYEQATEKYEEVKVLRVSTTYPKTGALERVAVIAGSVQAYQHVNLYSKVAGYMKSQTVDIGDRVHEGKPLIVIDVPELDKMVDRNKEAVKQATAKVDQMRARVATAKADLKAAQAAVVQAEASAKSAGAWLRFRDKQLSRMKDLFALKAIDERLVDESQERYEAAVETERSARASIVTANAQVAAVEAKILQAESDQRAAEAEAGVAQAELDRSIIQQSFATISAPFDGVVTYRSLFPGDYVRAANEGAPPPLLTVQRTDRMRVIVQIPDRDVPFADKGDPAVVQIDAFPGERIEAKITRISATEDPLTRLMDIEIEIPNPKGRIRHGMYGKVTLVLDKIADQLSVPSSCLTGRTEKGQGKVYVIRAGKAQILNVQLGIDNGLRVGVVRGLRADDVVIVSPPANLYEGAPVAPLDDGTGNVLAAAGTGRGD